MEIGTGGIVQWILDNILILVLLILAICVFWAARGGNISKGVTIAAGAMIGLAVLGLALGDPQAIGEWIAGLFTG